MSLNAEDEGKQPESSQEEHAKEGEHHHHHEKPPQTENLDTVRNDTKHHRHHRRPRSNTKDSDGDHHHHHRSRNRDDHHHRRSRDKDRRHSKGKDDLRHSSKDSHHRRHHSKVGHDGHKKSETDAAEEYREDGRNGHHKKTETVDELREVGHDGHKGTETNSREELHEDGRDGHTKAETETMEELHEEMEQQQREAGGPERKLRHQRHQRRKNLRLLCFCGCFVLVVVIVVLVVVLVLRNKTDDPPAENGPPMEPILPSSSPTDMPSVGTSTSPTFLELLFDPPSRNDCLAVQNGESVLGQSFMVVRSFLIETDITVNSPEYDVNQLLPQFKTSVDTILIPDLVGCFDTERKLEQSSLRAQHRSLQSVENIRYIIGNANSNVVLTGQDCLEENSPQDPCYRVNTYLDVFLKGDELLLRLINLITSLLYDNEDDPIIGRFGLPSEVLNAAVVGVISLNPTMAPSSMPSATPSSLPSAIPSTIPSGVPSASPSTMPSITPTMIPSIAPSGTPSSVPSSSPSTQPSSRPSFNELSDIFSEVIEVEPVEGDDEYLYTVPCDGDNGDIVILASGDSRFNVDCLGHLRESDYSSTCNTDGSGLFTVTLEFDIDDFNDYKEVLIGYTSRGLAQDLGCEMRSLSLGTLSPTAAPTLSLAPSPYPTDSPSKSPTAFPSSEPTAFPSESPSKSPTTFPSGSPSKSPTTFPSNSPSKSPTAFPSNDPTAFPSNSPTKAPTVSPSSGPTPA
eukprot:scaffold1008_cov124-Cylindrotheca_fusiformis.AAC.16